MAQKLNIDIVARDRTKQALSGVQGALGRLKRSVFSLQSAFIGLGAGLVVRNLVSTGKELENLRTRLKFLLKDTNEGAKAFDNMVKFASKVPFSLQEIQAGSGILATVTDNAEDLQKMLEITGNVASVTGLDFRTTAEQIQRSFSAGIGSADLFREKGVRNMLGFKAGATVSIEETIKAFERVFGKDGRFGKATDELAQTFEGTLSMINDEVFNFKKVLLEAGLFEELKRQFGDLDKFLKDNSDELDEIATTVGKNLAQAVTGAVSVGQDLIPTLQKIGSVLKSIKDGFMALPEFAREVGLVGAFLFGKKGAVALAGVSFIIDKVDDFVKRTKAEVGIFDIENMNEVQNQIDIINEKLKSQGKIITETITLNNGVTHTFEEHIDLGEETIKQLQKQKAELETILILNGKGSVNQFELNRHLKETTKELEKQKTNRNFVTNAFEADLDLLKRLEKAEKERTQRLIEGNRNIFDEQQKLAELFKPKEEKGAFDGFKEGLMSAFDVSVFDRFKQAGEQSMKSLKNTLTDFVMTGKLNFQSLKEAIVRSLVEAMIGSVVQSAIKKASALFKADAIKKALINVYEAGTKALTQVPPPFNFALAGMAIAGGLKLVNKIKGFQSGGAVRKGEPVLVGEQGAEMFIPNSTGQITQSARGTGDGETNVNFTINATDVRGVKELLIDNRATIVNVINSALNEKGKEALV
jgi:hypothetical protein|tara:strand:- start:2460 stop:4556 length:2097 start_codon:yes stop_codon:yes gene_type:complete